MKPYGRHLKNKRGLTMVELLVAGTIGVVLLGVAIIVFTSQEKALKKENEMTEVRSKGRHAINVIAKDLRMAGTGLPPNEGITSMGTTSVTFRSNVDGVDTTVPPGAVGSKAINAGLSVINVVDATGFSDNDYMVIYDPAFKTVHYSTVSSTSSGSPNTISFDDAIPGDITFAKNSRFVSINQYKTITISLSGTSILKVTDPSSAAGDDETVTVTNQAFTGTGLAFVYYDEDFATTAETSAVRKISITLKMPDPRAPTDAASARELKTDVELRNTR